MLHEKQALITACKDLLNKTLPAKYQSPVRYNHCFNRIILDWLFKNCWYQHLEPNRSAISQLTNEQLTLMIHRMQAWLNNKALLIEDNEASLAYRKKLYV